MAGPLRHLRRWRLRRRRGLRQCRLFTALQPRDLRIHLAIAPSRQDPQGMGSQGPGRAGPLFYVTQLKSFFGGFEGLPNPPASRIRHAMVFDEHRGVTVMVGGWDGFKSHPVRNANRDLGVRSRSGRHGLSHRTTHPDRAVPGRYPYLDAPPRSPTGPSDHPRNQFTWAPWPTSASGRHEQLPLHPLRRCLPRRRIRLPPDRPPREPLKPAPQRSGRRPAGRHHPARLDPRLPRGETVVPVSSSLRTTRPPSSGSASPPTAPVTLDSPPSRPCPAPIRTNSPSA